ALLPFAPGRVSAAGPGVRFGAYLIDYFLLSLLNLPLVLVNHSDPDQVMGPRAAVRWLPYQFLGFVVWALYFLVTEGLWGCSVGERLLGLRVWSARRRDRAGFPRVTLRSVAFEGMFALGYVGAVAMVLLRPPPGDDNPIALSVYANLLNAIEGAGFLAGL